MKVDDVAERLFAFLRQMDTEATTQSRSGVPTGLSDYGRHARADLSRPQCEVEWSRRLAELLSSHGVPTTTEVEYPDQQQGHSPRRRRKRRDLLLVLNGSTRMSVEVKGAWSDYWGRRNVTYRSYLLHPFVPGLDASKSHTVPFDLEKLCTLRQPDTDYIGQLLVGFESLEDSMVPDVELLKSLAGLGGWRESQDVWDSGSVPGQRVRCWFWYREALQ